MTLNSLINGVGFGVNSLSISFGNLHVFILAIFYCYINRTKSGYFYIPFLRARDVDIYNSAMSPRLNVVITGLTGDTLIFDVTSSLLENFAICKMHSTCCQIAWLISMCHKMKTRSMKCSKMYVCSKSSFVLLTLWIRHIETFTTVKFLLFRRLHWEKRMVNLT